jgi:hypothetical protein
LSSFVISKFSKQTFCKISNILYLGSSTLSHISIWADKILISLACIFESLLSWVISVQYNSILRAIVFKFKTPSLVDTLKETNFTKQLFQVSWNSRSLIRQECSSLVKLSSMEICTELRCLGLVACLMASC